MAKEMLGEKNMLSRSSARILDSQRKNIRFLEATATSGHEEEIKAGAMLGATEN